MVWVQAEPLGHRPRQAQLLPGGEPGLPQGQLGLLDLSFPGPSSSGTNQGVRFPQSKHLCEASPDLPACWQILYLLHSNFRSSREFLKLPRGIGMQPSAADVPPHECVTLHGVLASLFAM